MPAYLTVFNPVTKNAKLLILVTLLGIFMSVKLTQPVNVASFMFFTPSGSTILDNFEQLINADSPTLVTLSGRIIFSKFSQASKALLPILVIPFGIVILFNLLQPLNAKSPIVVTPTLISTFIILLHFDFQGTSGPYSFLHE